MIVLGHLVRQACSVFFGAQRLGFSKGWGPQSMDSYPCDDGMMTWLLCKLACVDMVVFEVHPAPHLVSFSAVQTCRCIPWCCMNRCMMCSWWSRMPPWTRSNWPSKSEPYRFIPTKVAVRKPFMWSTKLLKHWLTRQPDKNMTLRSLCQEVWRSTGMVRRARKRLQGNAGLPLQLKNAQAQARVPHPEGGKLRQNQVTHGKIAFWWKFEISWSSCHEICVVRCLLRNSPRNSAWFWRNGWATHQKHQRSWKPNQ